MEILLVVRSMGPIFVVYRGALKHSIIEILELSA